jgi:hypothetical protein
MSEAKTMKVQRAAKASWQVFVLAILLSSISGTTKVFALKVSFEILMLFLLLGGIIAGTIALFRIKQHGRQKILWPALTGIILNGLLLTIFISNVVKAAASTQ